jgi:hypothetical protein
LASKLWVVPARMVADWKSAVQPRKLSGEVCATGPAASIDSLAATSNDGGYDLATASRLLDRGSTRRCLKRELISRVYNALVRAVFHTRFSDAQCGFKAITRGAARRLLPLVEDDGWFMDTELLVLAEKLGYRIFEFPARWTEGRDSRVRIVRTALADLRGMVRLWGGLGRGGCVGAWERGGVKNVKTLKKLKG